MTKIIHQIFFEVGKYKRKDLSRTHPNWIKNMEVNKKLNPSYRHIWWSDKTAMAFVKKHYPQYLPMIRGFPHGFYFIDFFRYLVISKMGGIYIDMDVRCKRPLPNVDTILGIDYKGSINNNVIQLKPEDADGLVEEAVESYNRVKRDNMWAGKPIRRLLYSVGASYFGKYCRRNKITSDVKFNKYFVDEVSQSWLDIDIGIVSKGHKYQKLSKEDIEKQAKLNR